MMGDSDATRTAIKALLQPSTVAIAGASSDPVSSVRCRSPFC
jgi:hypothetical protein